MNHPAPTFSPLYRQIKGLIMQCLESGTRMICAEAMTRAVAADATSTELLRVLPDTSLLCVERVAFSHGEKPVEFRRGYYRTDKHYCRNEPG